MTSSEFYEALTSVASTERDYEEYLRALYLNVVANQSKVFSLELAIELFEASYTSEAPSLPEPTSNDKTDESVQNTLQVIRFHISEFHSMRGKQLDDPYRGFGISSDSGHSWYNFHPYIILECGARGFEDSCADMGDVGWEFIGELLEMGRIYE